MSTLAATHTHSYVTHGLPMTRLNTGSTGFTAVNGDSQRNTSFRPDNAINRPASTQQADRNTDAFADHPRPSTETQHHGWRADSRNFYPPQQDASDVRKRKRSDSDGRDSPREGDHSHRRIDRDPSPKRHPTNIDSAVDLTSPDHQSQVQPTFPDERRATEQRHVAASSREPSPVRPSTHTDPVPPPLPDIEAGLAESLQRELRNTPQVPTPLPMPVQQHYEHQGSDGPETSPPPDMDDDQYYSPEQQNGEYDPKKRKRNFSNRTKTGCHTCRGRKKKCDERKPFCANCERGNFPCGGYGAKPPPSYNKSQTTPGRTPMPPLQSKPSYEPSHGPTTFFQAQAEEGLSYSHWGRLPPVEPPRPAAIEPSQPVRPAEPWPTRPAPWQFHQPSPGYPQERFPPTEYSIVPPLHPYAPGHPPPMSVDPWGTDHGALAPYRPNTGYGAAVSSNGSASTASSQRTAALALQQGRLMHLSEKQKMMLGRPFLAYQDTELLRDRRACKAALERYNDSDRTDRPYTIEEHAKYFQPIVDPTRRLPQHGPETYAGPKGHAGVDTLVESPFTCDYGYNIHLGSEVLIQPGCYMSDACEIVIGDRTIVGPDVKFYGSTAHIDASARKGTKGPLVGGAIKIGEDCFIGGNTIIMPFRRIGKGAVVGAGSIVTKDVKEYTVVAGNPAKVIRRIEPGPNVERHHNIDIQDQNERMMAEMVEDAKRDHR